MPSCLTVQQILFGTSYDLSSAPHSLSLWLLKRHLDEKEVGIKTEGELLRPKNPYTFLFLSPNIFQELFLPSDSQASMHVPL